MFVGGKAFTLQWKRGSDTCSFGQLITANKRKKLIASKRKKLITASSLLVLQASRTKTRDVGWVGRVGNVNSFKLILRLHNEIKIVNYLPQKINAKTTEKRMPYNSDN